MRYFSLSQGRGIGPCSAYLRRTPSERLRQQRALRDGGRRRHCVFGLVDELAAHPLCFQRFAASFDPRVLVADAVGALFVLLFLSTDHNNVGSDLPVGVARCSAVTPLAVDLDVLVKLETLAGGI
jgi:hypothetical protein